MVYSMFVMEVVFCKNVSVFKYARMWTSFFSETLSTRTISFLAYLKYELQLA